MLDFIAEDRDPLRLAVLIDREARPRKIGIREGADRHRDDARPAFDHEGDGRSASRAEAIGGAMAAVGDALPGLGLAGDGDLSLGPACLRSKGAARALLAVEAMAYRNAHRLAFACGLELSAAATGRPGLDGHGLLSFLV